MPFSAPRSRAAHETSSENWTKPFVANRAVNTQLRWIFLTGTLIVGVFLQLGNSSNADSQEVEAAKAADNKAAETTTATPATITASANQTSGTNNAADATLSSVSVPMVKLNLIVDYKARPAEVKARQSVADALNELGIITEKLDRVWPNPTATKVSDGLKVRIETVREKLETRSVNIAPGFHVELTTKIAPGREQTVSNGKAGTLSITEKVVYVGGKRVRKSEISRKVSAPAQDKTIALGTSSRFLPNKIPYHNRYARAYQAERQLSARGGSPRDRQVQIASSTSLRPIKSMTMLCTGYCSKEGAIGGGPRTATGLAALRGAIAVDPRVIPLGTKLYVEGYGYGFACDTGGAIKGNHIDLAFDTVSAMHRQGSRKMKVWILADVD